VGYNSCTDALLNVATAARLFHSIHPVKAAAVSQRLRSRAEALFVGEARLGGVATVCDPTKGVFDREFVDHAASLAGWVFQFQGSS